MKIMRRKIAAFLIFFALWIGVFAVSVGAEESFYAGNIRAINEEAYRLGELMESYAEADATPQNAASIRTNAVIVRYVNMLSDLRADPRVSGEDLTLEIELYALRGEVSGACAWVVAISIEELSDAARERVESLYTNVLSEIGDCASCEELSANSDGYISGLILSIYEEKTASLCTDTDSAAVLRIADEAIRRMREIESTDREEYKRIYERAAFDIATQRKREAAVASFAVSYEQINGAGSFERDNQSAESIVRFLLLVSDAGTVEAFNSAIENSLLDALRELMGGACGEYGDALLGEVSLALGTLRAEADSTGEILDATSAFLDISRRILISENRDALLSYMREIIGAQLSERAEELLSEYNRVGGVFECAADAREAEFFLKQAKLRGDWILECERYLARAESFFGELVSGDITPRFEELYCEIDSEMSASVTLESTRDAMRRGRAMAEVLCTEFEAEAYRKKYADVIALPLANVTRDDEISLRDAILAYGGLSASAKELIGEEISAICQKYKSSLSDYLYYISSGAGDMQIALDYQSLIKERSIAGGADAFVRTCETLVRFAECEMRICAEYKQITANSAYSSFADGYKNALRECRDRYLLRVRELSPDLLSPDTELGVIRRSAALEMLRVYSEALIASFGTSDDSDAVRLIITSAIADLRFADSPEELEAATARAELDVYRQRAKESLTAQKVRTDASIELFSYLGASQKAEHHAQLSVILERAIVSLDSCEELSGVTATLDAELSAMRGAYETARLEDLAGARAWASARIDDTCNAVILEFETMNYIITEDRERFALAARDAAARARLEVELSASAADVESLVAACESVLASLASEACASDLTAARAAVLIRASSRADEISASFDALSYISATAVAKMRSALASALGAFESSLYDFSDVESVEAGLLECLAALADIERSAIAEELRCAEAVAEARSAAMESFASAEERATAHIDTLEYLSGARRSAIKDALEAARLELTRELASDRTTESVEAHLSLALEKIKTLEESAEQENILEARAYYVAALDAAFAAYLPDDYSRERYALIKDAYDTSRLGISTASEVGAIKELFLMAERSMSGVISIFEDKRAELMESVKAAYEERLGASSQYSKQSLSELAAICQGALDALANAEREVEISGLEQIANSAISQMRAVRVEWVSTGRLNSDSGGFAEYPAGYDYSVGGIWGVVFGSDGVPFDVRLGISLSESSRAYKKALRRAIDEARISYVGDMPMSDAEIRESLSGLVIKGIFTIKLIKESAVYDELSGEYTVRILLPQSMRSERTLRVVYISPDGDAEYYDAVCEEGMLVFKTKHFSDFLLLGERRVNLMPIIALLSLLAILEGVALIAIKSYSSRGKSALSFISPAAFSSLAVILPSGGVAIASVLFVINATLGVCIFCFARELIRERRAELTSRVYALPSDFDDGYDTPPLESAPNEAVAALPAYLDSVSAEDADELISDSRASALIIRSGRAPEVCRGCKKTFINVDTLSESFARGDEVSIASLRERGLIPASACYIKVLARGVIDKPLTVRAQSFSSAAVKMITLTGGRAILEGGDAERGRREKGK